MKMKRRKYAMSLVEVILALAIFGIIMVAFLSMFLNGILGIYGAGDKGVAYNLAQEDLDSRIASGVDVDPLPLTVEFSTNEFVIEGGFIDAAEFFRNKTSNLEAFIPILPRIQITPNVHFEGTKVPFTVTVSGSNTHFTSGTKVEVLSRNGTSIESINTINYVDAWNFSFSITKNLINSESDYVIKVFTPRIGLPDEVVRAKYSVEMPNLVAASDEAVYVSENGENWYKSYEIQSNTIGEPTAASYGDKRYLVAGQEGEFLLSSDYQGMTVVDPDSVNTIAINDVTWSNYYKKFFSVDNEGVIRASLNGDAWVTVLPSVGSPLNGISVTDTGKALAVGTNGTIYYSTNGTTWTNIPITGAATFSDVFAFNDGVSQYYCVIDITGNLYYSTDGSSWTVNNLSSSRLNRIEHYLGKLIVVGNAGLIKTSTDGGVTWTQIITDGVTNFIGSAFLDTNTVFVVGQTKMKKLANFSVLTDANILSGEVYKAITGK